jgi:predicted transcriptional regulator
MNITHPIQLGILSKLTFAQHLSYTDMKPIKDIENNQFQYHLDTLIKKNYVKKSYRGYSLTTKGKKVANLIRSED